MLKDFEAKELGKEGEQKDSFIWTYMVRPNRDKQDQ